MYVRLLSSKMTSLFLTYILENRILTYNLKILALQVVCSLLKKSFAECVTVYVCSAVAKWLYWALTYIHTCIPLWITLKWRLLTYMYVNLVMKENETTLEKSGWSLSMYVRTYVTKWLDSKILHLTRVVQPHGFRIFEITHTQRDLLILVYIHTYPVFARRINIL